jgi:hypothetical protein
MLLLSTPTMAPKSTTASQDKAGGRGAPLATAHHHQTLEDAMKAVLKDAPSGALIYKVAQSG